MELNVNSWNSPATDVEDDGDAEEAVYGVEVGPLLMKVLMKVLDEVEDGGAVGDDDDIVALITSSDNDLTLLRITKQFNYIIIIYKWYS